MTLFFSSDVELNKTNQDSSRGDIRTPVLTVNIGWQYVCCPESQEAYFFLIELLSFYIQMTLQNPQQYQDGIG